MPHTRTEYNVPLTITPQDLEQPLDVSFKHANLGLLMLKSEHADVL
jgi:hypothetical protein